MPSEDISPRLQKPRSRGFVGGDTGRAGPKNGIVDGGGSASAGDAGRSAAAAVRSAVERATYPGAAHEQARVRQARRRAGLAGEQATSAVDAVFDTIGSELAAGHDAVIAAFGKFSVAERAAREGRSPATGATIQIGASRGAKFSAAAALKQQLNG